ncbi:MAG: YybS family protein [candidate division Zixibacteria bacterium]|nr:YybS family protein [candidate division Zixibacteria bacterium]
MKQNGFLLALTFGLTLLATSSWLPAGLVFVINLALTAVLIFLFGRLPAKASLGWVLVLTVTSGWMGKSWMTSAIYFALALLPAAAAGLAVAKKLSYGRALLVMALSALVPTGLFVSFAYDSVRLQLTSFGETMKQMLVGLGSTAQAGELQKAVQSYLEFIISVIPALYFISSFFFLALAHLLALWALGRAGIFAPGPKKFVTWQAPFFLIFLLGVGLAGHLFLQNGWVKAADNLLLVVVFTYAICGTSNLEYFFKKLRTHWAVKGLFYIWLVLFGLASFFILSAVGFLDSRFDFRGLKKVGLAKESED